MKFFSTAGPIRPEDHYYVPLATRLNEQELYQLIEQKKYFALHAPRQTGKTSAILNFAKQLNNEGVYTALYVNIEAAQAARGDYIKGTYTILGEFIGRIQLQLPEETAIISYIANVLKSPSVTGSALKNMLQYWAENSKKPIILFIDEIDSLIGDTLLSVLRQLRAGYDQRPGGFPQSVCLVGVRDVRDYRIWSENTQQMVLGGSAFNIKAESLSLGDFSKQEVRDLYEQHTAETGQRFDSDALDYAFEVTQGQPWLVNALAYQACFKDVTDRSKPITKEILKQAKETLIRRRDTHLDVLIERLQEPRVRTVIDAIISSTEQIESFNMDDVQYIRDLGLISRTGYAIANPIYQEVIPRALLSTTEEEIIQNITWYQNADGSINMDSLMKGFTQFYRDNSEFWLERFSYKESGPHMLLMAFLQRIINGGGSIQREYALGRRRVDLLILWKTQRIVVEIKIWQSNKKTLQNGLEQTAGYMDTSGATEGHLVIFDKSTKKSWSKKIYRKKEKVGDKTIMVWGM